MKQTGRASQPVHTPRRPSRSPTADTLGQFADAAIEVCDATIPYVEDHLDEAGGPFFPGLYWCPRTGRLTEEVTP
ncbi:hypothetical protein ABZ153_10400 [Streptomyces sp. NPDC006290]|uniref:BP74-related protein n=1 Tax=Streptomyces sp. NPDC006290 TaxID=3156745 RepID=UPI0033B2D58A